MLKRHKNYIIALAIFLLFNAGLIAYMQFKPAVTRDKSDLDSSLALLRAFGVSVDALDTIPNVDTMRSFTLRREYTYPEAIALDLLGEGYFINSDKSVMNNRNNEELAFNGTDFTLTTKDLRTAPVEFAKAKQLIPPHAVLTSEGLFVMQHDRYTVFNSSLKAFVEDDIIRVEGRNWLKDTIIDGEILPLRKFSDVLMTLGARVPMNVGKLQFELGYVLVGNAGVPTWKFWNKDGVEIFVTAVVE